MQICFEINTSLTNEIETRNYLGVKNLLPNTYVSKTFTSTNISFIVNGDGSITANGSNTLSNALNYYLIDNKDKRDWLPINKELIFTTGLPYDSYGNIFIIYKMSENDTNHFVTNGGKVTFSQMPYYFEIRWAVSSNVQIDNKVSYPMLRLATDADTTYQPYSMTNQELTSYAQSQSNPNLLDNPWFTINQRGIDTVSTSGTYFVDRWKSVRGLSTPIEVVSGGLTIPTNGYLRQSHETMYSSFLLNSICTFSAIINNKLYSKTFSFKDSPVYIKHSLGDGWNVAYSYSNNYIDIENESGADTDVLRAVKLELGTVSTLAMDTAPNYATELLKCQRYFYRLASNSEWGNLGLGLTFNANDARIKFDFPTCMRAEPTVTTNGTLRLVNNVSSPTSITNISKVGFNKKEIWLKMESSSGLPNAGVPVVCGADNDSSAYIDFSADL